MSNFTKISVLIHLLPCFALFSLLSLFCFSCCFGTATGYILVLQEFFFFLNSYKNKLLRLRCFNIGFISPVTWRGCCYSKEISEGKL